MSTPTKIGALLDSWAESGVVRIVENRTALTISGLPSANAATLSEMVAEIGWVIDFADAAGQAAECNDLDDAMGPYIATLHKDIGGSDRRVLTRIGLEQALLRDPSEGIWQLAFGKESFSSGTISFQPWGKADIFSPSAVTKSPLDLVREGLTVRLAPADIRIWLLRDTASDRLLNDKAFKIFARLSAPALLRSLATELPDETQLLFAGPPRLKISLSKSTLFDDLGLNGYQNLKLATAWVYEDPVTAEQCHALYASEVARLVTRNETIGAALNDAGKDILESARLAFQLSQSDLSREAIKSQADLRKSIADDTSKTLDSTRTLAGALAVAIVTAITLTGARATGSVDPRVLSLVAISVSLYIIALTISGWRFLRLQHQIRKQWRDRFYRFVPKDDYEAMVISPAASADRSYYLVAGAGIVVAVALMMLAYLIWDSPQFQAKTPITGSQSHLSSEVTKTPVNQDIQHKVK